MSEKNDWNRDYLEFRIIQSEEIKSFELNEEVLNMKFREVISILFKKLHFKEKDVYFSTDEGKMINELYYNSPIKNIIQRYGNKLNLYYEKVF